MALGPKALSKARPWLPKSWKLGILADRCAVFQRYMTELYEEEKSQARLKAGSGGGASTKTLMSSLVRSSQDEAQQNGSGLTESEIYGNMFMLNFAGHDTTAHTFTFAIHFLAANPAVQDWVSEEVRTVLGDNNDWDYATHFPRLRRCFAVMLETLRLYTPVPVAKWTAGGTASLDVAGKTIVIPPNTMVIPSYAAVHTEPRYWGPDSLVWRPSRWIQGAAAAPGQEDLINPQKGTFLGWSEGARDCPARKFSQVEFVATIATLLRDWKVDPVPFDGESPDNARKRVLDLIKEDSGPVLLLQMLHPERVSLTWKRR